MELNLELNFEPNLEPNMEKLTADEREVILRRAIGIYGNIAQIGMLHEEMGELMVAINKCERAGYTDETEAHVREEIADVQIMLDQMRIIFGPTEEIEQAKLLRLRERLDAAE